MNRIEQIKDEIRTLVAWLRKQGVSENEIQTLFIPTKPLSRLMVTADYRIVLTDYGKKIIDMPPLPKAVYLLFLRHPEGIRFKDLPDYQKELATIYLGMKKRTQAKKKVEHSIVDLTDQTNHSIIEKCARIRSVFVSAIGEAAAQQYIIQGERGEVRRISLDRSLVTWEQKESPPDY